MYPQRIDRRIEAAFAILMASCAIFSAVVAVLTLRAPMQLDYEEGNILNAGLRITQGLTPYPDPHGWPIILNPYGPVPYLTTAASVKLFGIGFTAPRVITVLSGLAISALLALLIRRWGQSWWIGIGFGGAFLCTALVRHWLPLLRVDMLGLTLSLAGLCLFAFAPKRGFLTALLFVAALFVKHTLLAAPAACVLYMMAKGEWKRLGRAAAAGAALVLVGFFAVQTWSGGHFAFHMFGTHPDPYYLGDYIYSLRGLFRTLAVPTVLTLLVVVRDLRRKELSLVSLYAVTSILGASTVGKYGSNNNHLLELAGALCLCAGVGWGVVAGWIRAPGRTVVLVLGLTAVAAGFLATFSFRMPSKASPGCEQAYAFLRSRGDSVLAENVGALLLSGKRVLVSNPFVYTQLVVHAGWSDAPLQDRVRARQFDAILLASPLDAHLPDDRWTTGVLEQIRTNYHPSERFTCSGAQFAFLPERPSLPPLDKAK